MDERLKGAAIAVSWFCGLCIAYMLGFATAENDYKVHVERGSMYHGAAAYSGMVGSVALGVAVSEDGKPRMDGVIVGDLAALSVDQKTGAVLAKCVE